MRNESKNNEFVSSKTRRKDMRVSDYYNLWKTKKTMRKKIKIILIYIWFNYFFKLVLQLFISIGPDFWKMDAIWFFMIIFLNFFKRINDFFIKLETLSMDNLFC